MIFLIIANTSSFLINTILFAYDTTVFILMKICLFCQTGEIKQISNWSKANKLSLNAKKKKTKQNKKKNLMNLGTCIQTKKTVENNHDIYLDGCKLIEYMKQNF